jgi:glycosyltransferase involved in cell wall biosynthesis
MYRKPPTFDLRENRKAHLIDRILPIDPLTEDPDPMESTRRTRTESREKLHILLMSVHGLIRGDNPELGRDSDTGGQVTYILDLARSFARHPRVGRVDLVTRLIEDSKISADYAEPLEDLGGGARIVRIPFGPRRYLRKESLWPYLDTLADRTLAYLRQEGSVPDLIHGHYADSAYAGSLIAGLLDIPFVFTGHSLGRERLRRLRDGGMDSETIEKRYQISRRIEAEETALDTAVFVVASTNQEIDEQYSLYDDFESKRMLVIPPGIDTDRFLAGPADDDSRIARSIARFLHLLPLHRDGAPTVRSPRGDRGAGLRKGDAGPSSGRAQRWRRLPHREDRGARFVRVSGAPDPLLDGATRSHQEPDGARGMVRTFRGAPFPRQPVPDRRLDRP